MRNNWYKKIITSNNKASIYLTDDESFIVKFLTDMKNASGVNDVIMRICGGWVRDHLLNVDSNDIDIALSYPKESNKKITGEEFANAIEAQSKISYAQNNPIKKKWVVPSNELKSKNIAPAALTIVTPNNTEYKVEFVNLRTEVYDAKSRTPIQTSTNDPVEDASRRDLTINSMFYNIQTGQVEDYLNGRKDLETMTLRTPLDPKKTFMDDPLRVLRVLRFYSKYPNAKIDPSIIEAIKDQDVQNAYTKLAPERGSVEIMKMMKGKRPVEAVRILFETGLYKKVFEIPENYFPINMDQQTPYHNLTLMEHVLSVMKNIDEISKQNNIPNDQRSLLLLTGMLHDIGKMNPDIRKPHPKDPARMRYIGHDLDSAKFVKNILTKMGFDQDVKKFVETVTAHHMFPHELEEGFNTKQVGKFLNQTGDLYEMIMHHGTADALGRTMEEDERQKITSLRSQRLQQMKDYKQNMGDKINKTLIDGIQIKNILQQAAPLLVEKNAFIPTKTKPIHYLSNAISKLLEQQWAGNVQNIQQAEQFIRSQAKNWENLWKQQQSSKK